MSNLWLHGLQPTRLLCPWDSPDKSTGVACHSLLQGIFLTQGLNLGLLHCRQILYGLSHQGSPTDLELSSKLLNHSWPQFPYWKMGGRGIQYFFIHQTIVRVNEVIHSACSRGPEGSHQWMFIMFILLSSLYRESSESANITIDSIMLIAQR